MDSRAKSCREFKNAHSDPVTSCLYNDYLVAMINKLVESSQIGKQVWFSFLINYLDLTG